MPLPNGTTFRLDLRTANTIAAGLRILQELRASEPKHRLLKMVDGEHFDEIEGTAPPPTDDELTKLIDAVYDGSVLDEPEGHACKGCGRTVASLNVGGRCEGGCEPWYTCQGCGDSFSEAELLPIKKLSERVAPGEPMPAVECPGCGALCHEEADHAE